MRARTIVAFGTAVGLAVSVAIGAGEYSSLAAGDDPGAVGFGVSHLLFLLGLPWSAGVVVIMWAVLGATGADGPAALRPFFYAMPVIAGAAWAALAAHIIEIRRRRRQVPAPPAA